MVIHDKSKRVIIWGYKESDTEVSAPLLYLAPYIMRNEVLLDNGVTVLIPDKYLGSTYPIAAHYELLLKKTSSNTEVSTQQNS